MKVKIKHPYRNEPNTDYNPLLNQKVEKFSIAPDEIEINDRFLRFIAESLSLSRYG